MPSRDDDDFGAGLDLHERRYCGIYPVVLTLHHLIRFLAAGGLLILLIIFDLEFTAPEISRHDVAPWWFDLIDAVVVAVFLSFLSICFTAAVWAVFDLFSARKAIAAALLSLVSNGLAFIVVLGLILALGSMIVLPFFLGSWKVTDIVRTPLLILGAVGVFVVPYAACAALVLLVDYLLTSFHKIGAVLLLFMTLLALGNTLGMTTVVVRFLLNFSSSAALPELRLCALMVALCGVYAYVAWVWGRAAYSLMFVSKPARMILADGRSGLTRSSNLLGCLLGLASVFEFMRRPRRRFVGIIVLSFISAVCLTGGLLLALGGLHLVTVMFGKIWYDACLSSPTVGETSGCREIIEDSFFPALMILTAVLAIAAVFFLGGWAAQRGQRRLARLSLEALQKSDPRPAVLFLRAFRDDQVHFVRPKLGGYGHVMTFAQRPATLDEMLLTEGTTYGPVVALGNPTDARPPYGAARAYPEHSSWQDIVGDLIANSAAIVICVDNTDNIWWEIEHLSSQGHAGKTLFLFHPRLRERELSADTAIKILEAIGDQENAAALRLEWTSPAKDKRRARRAILGIFFDANGKLQVAQSSTFSQLAAMLTLRWFFRSKFGSKPIPLPAGT